MEGKVLVAREMNSESSLVCSTQGAQDLQKQTAVALLSFRLNGGMCIYLSD